MLEVTNKLKHIVSVEPHCDGASITGVGLLHALISGAVNGVST